jgi:hypothetical protein
MEVILSLTVEELRESESVEVTAAAEHSEGNYVGNVVRQHLSKSDSKHVYPLFSARKLAYTLYF